jgi:hypothetical protein
MSRGRKERGQSEVIVGAVQGLGESTMGVGKGKSMV